MKFMRLMLFFTFAASAVSAQVVLQALPPESPDTCQVRSQTMYKWLLDWPNLTRYREADGEVGTAHQQGRVVFMGDSITDSWDLAHYFPGKPYVNRGISAQTTPQMLLRFYQDVIALHPRAVVILAGTNDIAGNTGPLSLTEIENNYAAMADLARANHINVIFSSILPVNNYTPRSQRFYAERSMDKIRELNSWLQERARSHGEIYLDYYSQMLDEKGLLKRELAEDGLHPNDKGYRLMVPLAERAIAQAEEQSK